MEGKNEDKWTKLYC